ncbi:MAG TPA: hypothetical protein VHN79_08540, partial [Lacunisphaera sp.]|nr:hypothetical protein [Lacunisphaera sp.]
SAANLLSLSTETGASDLGFWALTAFGGGYAYTDKAAAVWSLPTASLFSNETNQSIPTAAATTVPDSLPLLAIVPTLLAVLVAGSRARRSVMAGSG